MKRIIWKDMSGKHEIAMKRTVPYSTRVGIAMAIADAVMDNGYRPYMFDIALRRGIYMEYTNYLPQDADEMMEKRGAWAKVKRHMKRGEYREIVAFARDMIEYRKQKGGFDRLGDMVMQEVKKQEQRHEEGADEMK